MKVSKPRRRILRQSLTGTALAGTAGASLFGADPPQESRKRARFEISPAEWSLHKAIQGNLVETLDFPRIARRTFEIGAIELVNTLLEVPTAKYIARLRKNATDEGVRKLMPFAKGVSAKAHDFDAQGNETEIDYGRMMKIVLDEARFSGYVGVEFEGDKLREYEGIWPTKRLLQRFQ